MSTADGSLKFEYVAVHKRGNLHIFSRKLELYPTRPSRYLFLIVVVLSTIILYYQQYVAGAVGPSIIAYYHISFKFYVNITVVASIAGAVASLIAGLADRWGRANIVVFGLLAASLVTFFGVPHATNSIEFGSFAAIVGFIEGLVLVATPALVRDFSPQTGRGAAVGFWTLGPVMASLVVSEVSSHTLNHLHAWQDQYTIAGSVGLFIFIIALFGLRELKPELRDQLMVSLKSRKLIELKVNNIDVATALKHPWKQMTQLNIALPALAVSVFLLIYYAAVGFFVVYFVSVFGFSEAQGNGLGNWFWAVDAIGVVVIGIISDRIRVRKPLMLIGALVAIVMTIIFLSKATEPNTTYSTFVVIISILSGSRAVAYSPWMTAFSETIESRNPALVATGLAIWGWILRVVVAVSFLIVPYVVTSATTLVTYGQTAKLYLNEYPSQIKTAQAIDTTTRAELRANSKNTVAIFKAISEIKSNEHVSSAIAIKDLIALRNVPKPVLTFLDAHGTAVQNASKAAPHEWQRWWWVCVGGEIFFVPTIFLLKGRWRPKTAKQDIVNYEAALEKELTAMAFNRTPEIGSL